MYSKNTATLLKRLEDIAIALQPEGRNGNQISAIRSFHVAFIIDKGKIISIGTNKVKSHSAVKLYDYEFTDKIHAELQSVLKLGYRENGYKKLTLAVLRVDRNGKINNSMPCPGCQSMIQQTGFKKVYYTDNNGNWVTL